MKRLWLPVFWSRVSAITTTPELHHEGEQVLSRLFQRTSGRWQYMQPVDSPSVCRTGEPA